MADTAALTIQQAFQTPFVRGVYTQFPTPDSALQRFYGSMDNRTYTPSRMFGWDQFNKTRTIGTVAVPMTDANVIRKQKIGMRQGYLIRYAEKLQIFDEEIANLRPPGSPIGTLDQSGEAWAARQVDFLTQRHRNTMEFLLSRMLLGGFGLYQVGQTYVITELNYSGNAYDIDMKIPASHKSQLALGTNGAPLIDKPWDDPTADLITFFFALREVAVREHGWLPDNCWISSRIAAALMHNIGFQSVGGAVNRVWNTVTNEPAKVDPSNRNLGGLSLSFNAIPWVKFHVNDSVVSTGSPTDPQGTDATTEAGTTRIIPANRAIITPNSNPEWHTCYEGGEPVQEQVNSPSKWVKGFHAWNRRMHQALAPSREAYVLDNFLPVLIIPDAVYCPTITGFEG